MDETRYLYHTESKELLRNSLAEYSKKSCLRTRQVYSFLGMDESEIRSSQLKEHISECSACLEEYQRIHMVLEKVSEQIPEAVLPQHFQKKFDSELSLLFSDLKAKIPTRPSVFKDSIAAGSRDFLHSLIDPRFLVFSFLGLALLFALSKI